jgi:type IV secretory pathway VirB4 component
MRAIRVPPAHRGTTAELRTVFPFVVPEGPGATSCLIGLEASGEVFCFDPWQCYARGRLTSPNMVVIGQIGRGKSAFVKSFLWRQRRFGRRCFVLDPKGEYSAFAYACQSAPLAIGPGLGLRLNPLDVTARHAARAAAPDAHRQRAELLGALLSASLGRPLLPPERAAADVALSTVEARLAVPTLPAVAEAMLQPERRHASLLGTDVDGLRHDGRLVALELRRLIAGDLAGMFDGETSGEVDVGAEVVVLDLSRLYGSAALGLLMVCALSWLQSTLASGPALKRLVVLDEAWAVLSQISTARWLQAAFKLSRAYGVANIAVLHRLSDLRAAGQEGSEQQRLAEGLLLDAETRVVFAQAAGEAEEAGEMLGLSLTERQLLTRLPRGVALWRVGQESYLVEHLLSAEERAFTDTDEAMREGAGAQRP